MCKPLAVLRELAGHLTGQALAMKLGPAVVSLSGWAVIAACSLGCQG